ncbi:hypothetical protein [Azospirillum brasilense]|uniref:hypothetical protein n=1 Tax=Azospirillum brasilense TaxID=192 RepID=UPI0013B3AFA9|nr:hypothetical protein [Azospirillum brasilense]
MKRSTAAFLAAALIGSVSSAPAMAGPDSTSIRPPPVGSAPLRAFSAASSDISARALLLDSNATIDGSRITGTVQNARNANQLWDGMKGAYVNNTGLTVSEAWSSWEANQAKGLAAGATINGGQVTGTVASAANATTASQAYNVYDARTNTWQWVNNVTVVRSDSTGTADRANQLYNNYNGNYNWASDLTVGKANLAMNANKLWDASSGTYQYNDKLWVWSSSNAAVMQPDWWHPNWGVYPNF